MTPSPATPAPPVIEDGTLEHPFYAVHTKNPPKECNDPLHPPLIDGKPIGKWFHPSLAHHQRCPLCCKARPSLSDRLRAERKRDKKFKAQSPEDRREVQAFKAFRRQLDKFKSEADKLNDEPALRSFGTYGKIRCSEREARLAQLDIAKDDGEAELDALVLSIVTGFSVGEILAMRQGEGRQPRYPEIRAFYQIQNSSKAIYARIRQLRSTISAWMKASPPCPACGTVPNVDVNKAMTLEGKLLDLEMKLFDLQPEPEKHAEISFGEKDKLPPETLAADMVAAMCLSEPPTAEHAGGPGPLR